MWINAIAPKVGQCIGLFRIFTSKYEVSTSEGESVTITFIFLPGAFWTEIGLHYLQTLAQGMRVWWAGQLEFAFCDVKVAIFLGLQAGEEKPVYSFREWGQNLLMVQSG